MMMRFNYYLCCVVNVIYGGKKERENEEGIQMVIFMEKNEEKRMVATLKML